LGAERVMPPKPSLQRRLAPSTPRHLQRSALAMLSRECHPGVAISVTQRYVRRSGAAAWLALPCPGSPQRCVLECGFGQMLAPRETRQAKVTGSAAGQPPEIFRPDSLQPASSTSVPEIANRPEFAVSRVPLGCADVVRRPHTLSAKSPRVNRPI
jgi:hypothetical protein